MWPQRRDLGLSIHTVRVHLTVSATVLVCFLMPALTKAGERVSYILQVAVHHKGKSGRSLRQALRQRP